jgi:hypothetical protein
MLLIRKSEEVNPCSLWVVGGARGKIGSALLLEFLLAGAAREGSLFLGGLLASCLALEFLSFFAVFDLFCIQEVSFLRFSDLPLLLR